MAKVTIQVADEDGPNISPMDEKTRTAPVTLDLNFWCEHISVMEDEADESEGGDVSLESMVRDFIELFDDDFDRAKARKLPRTDEIESHAVLFFRAAKELERLRDIILKAANTRIDIVSRENREWDERIKAENKKENIHGK